MENIRTEISIWPNVTKNAAHDGDLASPKNLATEKPERRDERALTAARFVTGKALRDTLSGRCCRIAPGFWPNISIVSTGEPSAEYFDRLPPRQLAHEPRVLALGLNMS